MQKFFRDELDLESPEAIEFQRVHRVGKKETGSARPIIARFLRFPDPEFVFRSVLDLGDETDVKVYADLPKEIRERRKKQWPRKKKAREEGKTVFFSRPETDKLFINGEFVPL